MFLMRNSIKINAVLNTIKQITQVIFPIITIPYITRVLLPENFGKINFGNSVISYISLIAGLGINAYAIREGSLIRENKREFNNFSNQVFTINVVSTFLSYLILAIILITVSSLYEYRLLLIIQSVSIIFSTLGTDWINSIEEDYIYLTVRYILFHLLSLAMIFLFVKKIEDYYTYAIISLITSAGTNILNIFYVRRYVKIKLTPCVNLRKHIVPIMILFSNAIAMTIYVSSDMTMLGFLKGNTDVGIYAVPTKIYSVVKQILNAILVVSIPKLTMLIGLGDVRSFIKLGTKISDSLVTIMFPFITGVIVFRKEAIYFVGGDAYSEALLSLLILSLAVISALIATFFSSCVLMPMKMEGHILKGTIIAASINVILNFIFIPMFGISGAAFTTLISETYIALYFHHLIEKKQYRFFDKKVIMLSVLGTIIVATVSTIIKIYIDGIFLSLSLSVFLSGMLYIAIQILGNNYVVRSLYVHIKNYIGKNRHA